MISRVMRESIRHSLFRVPLVAGVIHPSSRCRGHKQRTVNLANATQVTGRGGIARTVRAHGRTAGTQQTAQRYARC